MAPINFSLPVALVLLQALFAASVQADLRIASTPKENFKVITSNNAIPFASSMATAVYLEPSTFNYAGLQNQKNNNYDNFLRSNIDNEQDNRNFQTEPGKDMLPFRTLEAASTGQAITVAPGVQQMIPLRWNNPHSSEMEVNVWIMNNTIVVPVKKPVCSGEGRQDSVLTYTIPADFNTQVSATVPNFAGCTKVGDCTLQIYAHSVEPRTYAIGIPIIISGYSASATKAKDASAIAPATTDPGATVDKQPNDVCLPMLDASSNIASAQPRYARQVSDVFNHAYQNSDYSPYSGQQQESISKNLQAATVLRMTVGNRGELGKAALSNDLKNYINDLANKVNNIVSRYETAANNVIGNWGNNNLKSGGITVMNQKLQTEFRCAETACTNHIREQTNTYIPSFAVPAAQAAQVKNSIQSDLRGLMTANNVIGIYVASLNDMKADFDKAALRGVKYQPAMVKTTAATMSDATQFRKVDASGKADNGVYAANLAFVKAGVRFTAAFVDGSDKIDTTLLPPAQGTALAANPDDSMSADSGSSGNDSTGTTGSGSNSAASSTVMSSGVVFAAAASTLALLQM